ncbi:MAG TPA: hypothetical protein VGC94_00260 [Amnibacterium sp.]
MLRGRAQERSISPRRSTGIVTAARYWRIPVACAGTREVLASLPRFEDSNRIPLVLIDLTVPKVAAHGGAELLPPPELGLPAVQRVLATVGYCMQWRARHAYRDDAVRHLLDHQDVVHAFVPRPRLRTLLLPGGVPMVVSGSAFTRVVGLLVGLRSRQLALRRGLRRLGVA